MIKEIIAEKEPTKSIAWLSIPKQRQEFLMQLYCKGNGVHNDITDKSVTPNEMKEARGQLDRYIQETMGTKFAYGYSLNAGHLNIKGMEEALASEPKGEVFDQIREYLIRFRTIKAAVEKEVEQQKNKEKCINL